MELDVLVWGYLTIWMSFLKLFSSILINWYCSDFFVRFFILHCDSEAVAALGPFCGKVAVNFCNFIFLLNKRKN